MLGSFQIKTNAIGNACLLAFNSYTSVPIADKLNQIELNKDPKEKAIALGNLAKEISFIAGNKKDSIRIFISALSIRRGKDDWIHIFAKVFPIITSSGLSQKDRVILFKTYLKDTGSYAPTDTMLASETAFYLCDIAGAMLSLHYNRKEALQIYKMAFSVAHTIIDQNERQKVMNIVFMLMKNWGYKSEDAQKLLNEVQASN